MKVWRPDSPEPTPEECKELERLKAVLEAAIADGKLSGWEISRIKDQARADGKVTVGELELYRKMVTEKIATGELEYEWS